VLDAVTPPSLRGARYLAPYGHDGRFASLRDFIRNVIVGEFAGPEPAPQILDALVTYVQEISFLPNPNLGKDGRLTEAASASARRGEVLFHKPFPRDASLSCAACHQPTAGHCHVNRKFADQMTMAVTVHAATVAWRHVSIA
jgi:cytochrome c peroxidase